MTGRLKAGISACVLSAAFATPAIADPQRVGLHCQIPDGHHMIREVMACPDGSGTQYESWSYMSNSTYGLHLDWEPVSYMSFPYPVGICENGFVVDRAEEDWDAEAIAARSSLIADPDYQALVGQQTSHFIYARLLELEGADLNAVSWHYLNSTWEAAQCGLETYDNSVREFLRVADEHYSQLTPEDDAFLFLGLLRSNMNRRIGEFATARALHDSFVRDHGDLIDEDWQLAFSLLDEAIDAQSTDQIAISAPETP